MLKAKGRNFDNVSIAQTKSSKTLKSKINNNPEVEVKKLDPPYFKEENIYKEIEVRAKKENSRFSGLLVKTTNYNHLDKANLIVQDLLNRHKATK
jgi:ribosomal protein L14